jgi:hypothetical protein
MTVSVQCKASVIETLLFSRWAMPGASREAAQLRRVIAGSFPSVPQVDSQMFTNI